MAAQLTSMNGWPRAAGSMQRPREQALARSGLAEDQQRGGRTATAAERTSC
jgi:hypothetical protein